MCVCGCANMCVSKLVFSFNCETAFLLISWCRGALIHFKETFLTVTLTLMTSLEWMLFTSVLLHLKIHSVWFGSILWQNVFICGYKSSCVFLFFFFHFDPSSEGEEFSMFSMFSTVARKHWEKQTTANKSYTQDLYYFVGCSNNISDNAGTR